MQEKQRMYMKQTILKAVIVKFRDDITAGDGVKSENLVKKGFYNSVISSKFFEVLEECRN